MRRRVIDRRKRHTDWNPMPNSGQTSACQGRRDASPGWKALQGVEALAGVNGVTRLPATALPCGEGPAQGRPAATPARRGVIPLPVRRSDLLTATVPRLRGCGCYGVRAIRQSSDRTRPYRPPNRPPTVRSRTASGGHWFSPGVQPMRQRGRQETQRRIEGRSWPTVLRTRRPPQHCAATPAPSHRCTTAPS